MTTAPEPHALMERVGHYYKADHLYSVDRTKVLEYARAVQDYHPAHWDDDAAAALGYSGLVAPLTFTPTPGTSTDPTGPSGVTDDMPEPPEPDTASTRGVLIWTDDRGGVDQPAWASLAQDVLGVAAPRKAAKKVPRKKG